MKCYFFGTFNPIHVAHLEIAQQIKSCGFDEVVFVPSYMPPHKIGNIIPFEHRYNMVKLAVGKDSVSDIELNLQIPSYSYRTIDKLCKIDKVDKINFIIGYDQFFSLEGWKRPEKIKNMTRFIVVPRRFKNNQVLNNSAFDYFRKKGYDFKVVELDFMDVSSEDIRNKVQNQKDITGLVTDEVKNYIENNGLYTKLAGKKSYC